LIANLFFEATHRVQVEYGHRVVQAGPYRLVRHPGYLGVMLEAAGAAAVLGSCLACLPAAGIGAAMWARAAFEDRALRRDIDGYEAYTKRTRSLVLPGIPW
jgi:protein-S-isoprenylcysteine O-methyltransferase Ste14